MKYGLECAYLINIHSFEFCCYTWNVYHICMLPWRKVYRSRMKRQHFQSHYFLYIYIWKSIHKHCLCFVSLHPVYINHFFKTKHYDTYSFYFFILFFGIVTSKTRWPWSIKWGGLEGDTAQQRSITAIWNETRVAKRMP